MRNSILLLVLVLVVVAVTGLNHYTTQSSTAYFSDAQDRAQRDLFYIKTTAEAQVSVKQVAISANVFLQERDYARKYALNLREQCESFYEIIQYQSAYIEQLEKSVLDAGLKLPTPLIPAPEPDPNQK